MANEYLMLIAMGLVILFYLIALGFSFILFTCSMFLFNIYKKIIKQKKVK